MSPLISRSTSSFRVSFSSEIEVGIELDDACACSVGAVGKSRGVTVILGVGSNRTRLAGGGEGDRDEGRVVISGIVEAIVL